jgi:imidazolonepropionase-like amidohydrolase
MPVTAFVGATVIDGHGRQPIEQGTVLAERGRFLAIGSAASTPVPSDAEVIDLSGRYLLPGLMDANVHLLPWPSWSYIEFLARYEDRFDAVITEAAQVALNMRTVSLVVKDGQVIDRSALPSSRLLTSPAATSPGRVRTR